MAVRLGDGHEPTGVELAVAAALIVVLLVVMVLTAHDADRGVPNDDQPTTEEAP